MLNNLPNNLPNNLLNMANKMKDLLFAILFVLYIIMALSSIPMTILNLYYGFNDLTCVSNSAKPLAVNLKDYLIVDGIMSMCIPIVVIVVTIMANKYFSNDGCPEKILSAAFGPICGILAGVCFIFFKIIWSIIGGMIFWKYMDNSTCSPSLFNYVFTSLIIKYVLYFCAIIMTNRSIITHGFNGHNEFN